MKVFDAIVLAGGEGRRLGGVDKALLQVGGTSMLERVLGALRDAQRIVCVGPERPTSVPVIWTREDPPGGGPTPAVAAGLQQVVAPNVVVLAVDVPLISREVVAELVAAEEEAALVTDYHGVPQPLIAAYDTDLVRERLRTFDDLRGVPINRAIEGMSMTLIADPLVANDCDTWDELERIRKEVARG